MTAFSQRSRPKCNSADGAGLSLENADVAPWCLMPDSAPYLDRIYEFAAGDNPLARQRETPWDKTDVVLRQGGAGRQSRNQGCRAERHWAEAERRSALHRTQNVCQRTMIHDIALQR